MKLKQLYNIPGKIVVTAHRGFSGAYPENTLTAFNKAMEVGADIVEFDVRETRDGEIVVLHDATLDRTTDGKGEIASLAWAEVRKLNATYWVGAHKGGSRVDAPLGTEGIPRFSDALALMSGRVGMNIQVYTESEAALERVVRFYLDHGLEESAYLMLRSFEQAEQVRKMHPKVALCVGEDRDNLERHLAFSVDFVQPKRLQMTDEFIRQLHSSGVGYNVFFANDEADMRCLIERGVRGIMTDEPDRLLAVASGYSPSGGIS